MGYWGTGENGELVWRDFEFQEDPDDSASRDPSHHGGYDNPAPAGTPSGTPFAQVHAPSPAPAAPRVHAPSPAPAAPSAPAPASGAASDGSTFQGQSPATQAMFQAVWGVQAAARWVQERNQFLQSTGAAQPAQAPGPAATQPTSTTGATTPPRVGVYDTVNGPRTVEQMTAELMQVGWGGQGEPLQVYAETTGGPVTVGGAPDAATATPSTVGGAPDAATATPSWFTDYLAAENARQLAEAEEEKRRWELQYALSQNADERAAAATHIAEAQQKLAEAAFKVQQTQFNQQMFSGLATSLLGAASGLRGPRDYAQYFKTTNAGRGLIDTLYGDQGRPTFSSPTDPNKAITLEDLINDLGLGSGGMGGLNADASGATRAVPRPHQINPAVFDSLGTVGQQLTLGAAEAGQTEGGAYDPQDFLSQLNATRPLGQTANRFRTQYPSLI